MAFGLFKKRTEIVDLRKKDSDMPVPAKIMDRLKGNSTSSVASSSLSNLSQSPQSAPASGGFFNFFGSGGNSDSSSSSIQSTPAQTEAPTADFWGNPVNNSGSETTSSNTTNDSQLNDVSSKVSRMIDRLELTEKKIERLERKLGIRGE